MGEAALMVCVLPPDGCTPLYAVCMQLGHVGAPAVEAAVAAAYLNPYLRKDNPKYALGCPMFQGRLLPFWPFCELIARIAGWLLLLFLPLKHESWVACSKRSG